MTLEQFIINLKRFTEENPEALKMQVITSEDDEGNWYNKVCYEPSKGVFNDGDFQTENEEYRIEADDYNAVCIN